MAAVAERHYREPASLDRVAGFTTAPHGTAEALPGELPTRDRHRFGAPPDARTRAASRRPSGRLALVRTATADDLVLVLLSGGASALWAAPAAGLDTRGQDGADARPAQVAAPTSTR